MNLVVASNTIPVGRAFNHQAGIEVWTANHEGFVFPSFSVNMESVGLGETCQFVEAVWCEHVAQPFLRESLC